MSPPSPQLLAVVPRGGELLVVVEKGEEGRRHLVAFEHLPSFGYFSFALAPFPARQTIRQAFPGFVGVLDAIRCALDVPPGDGEVAPGCVRLDLLVVMLARPFLDHQLVRGERRRIGCGAEHLDAGAGRRNLGVAFEVVENGLRPRVDRAGLGIAAPVEVDADEVASVAEVAEDDAGAGKAPAGNPLGARRIGVPGGGVGALGSPARPGDGYLGRLAVPGVVLLAYPMAQAGVVGEGFTGETIRCAHGALVLSGAPAI